MTKEIYMMVRKGYVQRLSKINIKGIDMRAWPVAENHADAKRLARRLGGHDVVPARIGSIPGETLEGHILPALEDGCRAIVCVDGWDASGNPKWKSILTDIAA